MKNYIYPPVQNNPTKGFIHHKITEDKEIGKFKYECIEVNDDFEALTGLKRHTLSGDSLPEIMPRMLTGNFKWKDFCQEVLAYGGEKQAICFSCPLQKWFTFRISSPAQNRVTTLISEGKDEQFGNTENGSSEFSNNGVSSGSDQLKQLEQQLAEYKEQLTNRKKQLKSYFDANPTATYIWEYRNGEILLEEVNKTAMLETHNWINSFIGRSSQEVFEESPQVHQKLHHCYTTGEEQEFVLHYRPRYSQGQEWIKFKLVYQEPDKILLFSETITRQKQAQQDLIEAKEYAENNASKYRAIYLNAPLAFQSLNDQGELIDVNPMWLKTMGFTKKQVLGRWFGDFIHPDDIDHFRINFPAFKQRGFVSDIEFKLKTHSGDYIDVIYEGCVGYTESGVFKQTYCVFKDISDQKKTEQALKQSERLLNNTQHLSKVGGWEYCIKTQYMKWTRETYRIHDIDPDTHISGTPGQIIENGAFYQPADSQRITKAFDDCINKGIPFDFEVPFTSYLGKKKWVRTKAEALYDNNRVERVLGNIIDITERKLAEQEHEVKQKLEKKVILAEESLRFKQNFLANMSHEIRTPLTGMLGMAEILGQTALNDEQKDFLNTIIQSGDNLREIINNVLDFSKIEAGKVKLRKDIFSLKKMATNTRQYFNSICRKPIVFESAIDEALPEFIKADDIRLRQILTNLISNAVKFTDQGKISFMGQLLSRNPQTNTIEVKFSVTDTGKGIDPNIQQKLFTPFSQIEDNDTREFEGTGLGLSICRELVKLHGGNIGVNSIPGHGSTFWFTMMVEEASQTVKKYPQHKLTLLPQPDSLKILLAEDKVTNQKVIKLILASLGHEVTIAQNGREAIEMYEPLKFDLILMDIQMPVLDGIKATRKLKEQYKVLPPIVGLSANAFEGDREKYMTKGLDEYLIKPLQTEDFKTVVAKLFV